MADTLAVLYPNDLTDARGLWGPYWTDINTAIIIYIHWNYDVSYVRTTDKGANWSRTAIEAGTATQVACWFDKETPGDFGDKVHIAWLDGDTDEAYYINIDVATNTVGTKRTVDSTIDAYHLLLPYERVAITKTVSGNIIVAFSTQSEIECYKSSDEFASAGTAIADVFETGDEEDWCLLFPANTGDDNDACAIFWDRSANEITVKMYDDSADSWVETLIAASMIDDGININMDGAVRHSDKHILVAAHSDNDFADDDLRTWDLTVDSIASPTVTAKTNIFTAQPESAQVAVFINQQNDDVYVAHLKGGAWLATVDVVFHISDDGMGTWGAEQAYSEAAADDIRFVQAGRTVGNDGGRYQPLFYNDDPVEIYVNETNDIEIAAAVVGADDEEFAATQGLTFISLPPMLHPVGY